MQTIVTACRETGVLMSPSDTSSSDAGKSEDGDDEGSCHGFSSSSPEPNRYSDIEQDPTFAVILHTIQQRQQQHERLQRLSSTREDFLDQEEDDQVGAVPAPHQEAIQPDVLHHAQTTPPHQSATPEVSPIQFQLRSGRTIQQGAPRKKEGGTRQRR